LGLLAFATGLIRGHACRKRVSARRRVSEQHDSQTQELHAT
jgi:hypothetical protein